MIRSSRFAAPASGVLLWLGLACQISSGATPPPESTATGSPVASVERDADYQLGVGDSVSIAVFGEPDMSQQARIGESGRFSYPFIGDVKAIGMTVRQLEQELTRQLKGKYLVDPQVSVAITQYRPFFINGQVKSPGSYPFQPGMTVRKAVSIAGGLTERASERRIRLIPETKRDSKQARNVSLDDPIGPGDIITVEESFF
jgi:polysaccharide export outer membrane protein